MNNACKRVDGGVTYFFFKQIILTWVKDYQAKE